MAAPPQRVVEELGYCDGQKMVDDDLSMPAHRGYVALLLFIAPGILMGLVLEAVHTGSIATALKQPLGLLIAGFVILIVAHEGLHAAIWKAAGGLRWSDFRFGVQLSTLTPYAHAKVPMTARAYRLGAIAPALVQGVLPWSLGIIFVSPALALIGSLMMVAAAGDLLILWLIRRVSPADLVADHPTNFGCLKLATEQHGDEIAAQ